MLTPSVSNAVVNLIIVSVLLKGVALKRRPPNSGGLSLPRGNNRAIADAAHNSNNRIAIGALIQVKTPQGASFRVTGSAMRKKKRQRNRAVVVRGDGDPCPRCGVPMQIREYSNLTDKDLHRPYFYTRWFCCMNKSCRTTLVMPERYKVMNPAMLGDALEKGTT
jgi:hypothetical protein